jgi:hypothetical protein
MPSGVEMLLNSLGIDPAEMRQNIEGFMLTMKTAAEKINANQSRLEAGQARIEEKLDAITNSQEQQGLLFIDMMDSVNGIAMKLEQPGETTRLETVDGRDAHVLLTTEKFPRDMLREAGIITEEVGDGRS